VALEFGRFSIVSIVRIDFSRALVSGFSKWFW
jgi:hypothetical protein